MANLDLNSLFSDEKTQVMNEQQSIKNERKQIESKIQNLNDIIEKIKKTPLPKFDEQNEELFKKIISPAHYATLLNLLTNYFQIASINKNRVFALDIPIAMKEQEKSSNIHSFLEAIKPVYLSSSSFKQKELPIYEITFNLAKNSPISPDEFTKRIHNVCEKFGAIVFRFSKYKETNTGKNPTIQGHIYVYMYAVVFTIPLTSMAADEILGVDRAILRIPNQMNIDILSLSQDPKMSEIMKDWFSANDLEIHMSKNKWNGTIADSFVYLLGRMFDDDNHTPLMNKIYENTNFIGPKTHIYSSEGNVVPIGQLMWSFISDLDIAINARAYISQIWLYKHLKNLLLLLVALKILQFYSEDHHKYTCKIYHFRLQISTLPRL